MGMNECVIYHNSFCGVHGTISSAVSVISVLLLLVALSSVPLVDSVTELPRKLWQFLCTAQAHDSLHWREFVAQPQWPSLHPFFPLQPQLFFERFAAFLTGFAFRTAPASISPEIDRFRDGRNGSKMFSQGISDGLLFCILGKIILYIPLFCVLDGLMES